MVRRVSRWVSVMSVLALSSVSALVALPGPAGAGFEVVEANCELPAERLPGSSVPQQELVLDDNIEGRARCGFPGDDLGHLHLGAQRGKKHELLLRNRTARESFGGQRAVRLD